MGAITKASKLLCLALIHIYQWCLRPFFGSGVCRFYPSCSQYALEAFTIWGPLKGFRLVFARILRCHPWSPGGVDLVPNRRQ